MKRELMAGSFVLLALLLLITVGAELVLAQEGSIAGYVSLEDGVTPVVGACFWVDPGEPGSEDGWPYCLSGPDGAFTIPGLTPGIYYLHSEANDQGWNPHLVDEWYTPGGGTPDHAQAAPIEVLTGSTTSGITFTLATQCVVASTADSGSGTLRQCLELAEAGDTITFDPGIFPPGNPATITLASDLPPLLIGHVTVDGSGAGVIVEGSGFHIWSDGNRIEGLQIYNAWTGIEVGGGGSYNVITGNVLSGHGWAGVDLHDTGTMSNTVSGNLIGTDASGTVAIGNGAGVKVRDGAQYNLIGGDTPAERNVISGSRGENIADGVALGAASYNTVIGNYIGTDIHGTTALPNLETGVDLCCGASHNTIGGTSAGERNIISGSGMTAVRVFNAGTDYNVIRGNYIGTDATGTIALPNWMGVFIWQGARHNVVGGTGPGEGNLISGNAGLGVAIWGTETLSNTVVGNLIGTDPTGMAALGNGGGIGIEEAAQNIIGGDTPAERNVISGNGGGGLALYFGAHHNTISGNYIGTDIAGSTALPNQGYGVGVSEGSNRNLIGGENGTPGGECAGACNLISGNHNGGVIIDSGGTLSNTVSGNYIGTDVAGTAPIPNGGAGVTIMLGAAQNLVGGDTAAQRNIITYNYGDGVSLSGANTIGNRIEGNWIGVDVDGTRDVDVSVVAYSPAYASDRTIFLGTVNQGLFKSTDGGVHWSEMGGGVFEGSAISGLAFSPAYGTDGTLFVGAGGLLKSTDGGATWTEVSPLSNRAPRSFALSPDYGNDQTLLAGYLLRWEDGQMVGGVFKSTDGGLSWVQLDLSGTTAQALAAETPGGTWVGLLGDREPWFPGAPIVREPAEGEGPAMVGSTSLAGRVVAFSPDYAQDQTLFVGTWGGDGSLYKSVDAGVTWAAMNSGLGGTTVSQISFSPDYGHDETLFVMSSGSGAHPYRSTDGGTTWDILTTGLPADESAAVSLSISPGFAADHTLYVVYLHWDTGVGGLFRSLDRGDAWTEAVPGLQHQHLVRAVAVSPNHAADNELLLAAGANGLLRSQDRGDTWLLAGSDLTDAGNSGSGVGAHDGAQGNLIGGEAVGTGNLISNNGYNGVTLEGAGTSGNRVMGNYIGTDASGTDGLRNAASGVRIRAGALENTIGGLHLSMGDQCSGVCNLISGNGGDGVRIEGTGTVSNTVSGNYIGTDPWGMERNGNMQWGVIIDAYASHNLVGGMDEGLGNLISGNDSMSLGIRNSSDNQVLGNFVGTDATGTTPLPNGAGLGVYFDAKRNLIEKNVIAGNNFYGLQIGGGGAADNVVRGNWIGTNASDHNLGNAWGGIEITSDAGPNTIGPGNVIKYNEYAGVAVSGHDNRIVDNEIAYNGDSGVGVAGQSSLRNTITINSIYGNGGLGINLEDGGNTELPAPVVWAYDTATGTASGTACALCTVEVFSDDDDEGRWYQDTVEADEFGYWALSLGTPFQGANVHATVTDADGNTSEFSGPLHDIAVVGAAPGGEVAIGEASGVHAELLNQGNQLENNVPVRCSIEDAGYDETQISGEIQPATWAMVAFSDWVPVAGGVFTLTCESLLGDENPANDRFTQLVTVTVPGGPDVWTRDNEEDTGDVPSTQPWWVSPDIWVRHRPDGGLVHQNPIAFEENTVYVRLRNRGRSPASGIVQVFWDRSRIGWPCKVGEPNVGTVPFEDLAPGEVKIVSLAWQPQEVGHHGLHTVIEAEGDPANVGAPCSPHRPRWDNNVSWHNVIAYFHPPHAGARPMSLEEVEVDLVNVYDWPKDTDLVLERGTFPAAGTIRLRLDEDLFDRWWSYEGRWQEGVAVDEVTKLITVTGEVSATVGALPLAAGEQVTATLAFAAPDEGAFEVRLYERVDGVVVGGISFRWLDDDRTPPAVAGISPADGAVEVALDAPLVVTFTEAIGPLSLSLATTPDPGGWHLAWDASGTVLTATHGGLALTTTYAANVTAGDAFGNAMPAPYAWAFSTGKQAYWWIYLPVVMRHD